MSMEPGQRAGTPTRTQISPALSELLRFIGSSTQTPAKGPSTFEKLVAFRNTDQAAALTLRELTFAFRKCFLAAVHSSNLRVNVLVTDWLSDLVKSSSLSQAPTPIIQELSKVFDQLSLSRKEAEECMPLLISLCNLTDSCLATVRRLDIVPLGAFLEDPACMTLASIVLETGMRVFRHIDRNQEKRERSDNYTEWNKKTLDLTKNLQEFAGEQVQQSTDLRARAGDVTIGICNMLIRYAEMARSEYVYLNLAFKFIIMLAPSCVDNRSVRLERAAAVRLLCESILGTLLDIFHVCSESVEVGEKFLKRHWILAQFYRSNLRYLIQPVLKDVGQGGDEALTCRGLLRHFLFSLRSRFILSEAIKKNHPDVQAEMLKFVGTVEDIVVPVLLSAYASPDKDMLAVFQDFSTSSGPRAAYSIMECLTDHEWNLGRLYFLLKTLSIFDEFPPSLQLQLYPLEGSSRCGSLLSRLVDCVSNMDLYEVMSLRSQEGEQDSGDLYVRILSELCTFVHLVQPKQFARLQIDMMGLVLGRSELWSMLAIDWWTCMADTLGQEFTRNQVNVLTALVSRVPLNIALLLSSLPIGRASDKIACLLASIIPALKEQSQVQVIDDLLSMMTEKPDEELHTLLSCFPYSSINNANLDSLVEKCSDGWRNACNLLSDESIVLEAFYAMRTYIACLASVLSVESRRNRLPDELRLNLVSWSIEIIGGVNELLAIVRDDDGALSKISSTVENIVSFLSSMQPLQGPELIQVLNTFQSWEDLPERKRPLSKLSMSLFLRSCSAVEIAEVSQTIKLQVLLRGLYSGLLEDKEWIVAHESLQSLPPPNLVLPPRPRPIAPALPKAIAAYFGSPSSTTGVPGSAKGNGKNAQPRSPLLSPSDSSGTKRARKENDSNYEAIKTDFAMTSHAGTA
ncbi:hypothetical protein KVV02_002311 [Mortierella alpina]|uniref:Uncharacterized protein n=1 Tax=Mortierella alpina TaxID=64518 RepID=A0A9P8A5M2_MORAP|nr:hypothetical protein KVV02_002311 [Mortierella alpina]